jgi:hypothetical protein
MKNEFMENPEGRILLRSQQLEIPQEDKKIKNLTTKEIKGSNGELLLPSVSSQRTIEVDYKIHDRGSSSKYDWLQIQKKWKNIPEKERWSIINFKHLGPGKLANIVEFLPLKMKESTDAFLKVDHLNAPTWAKDINFSVDGINANGEFAPKAGWSLEMSLKGMMTRPAEYLAMIDQVKKDIGSASQLDTPTLLKRGSISFHEHFSLAEENGKKQIPNFKERILAYRRWLLIKLLSAGEQYEGLLTVNSGLDVQFAQNIHDREIDDKHTTIRAVDSINHFEVKEHYDSPKAELSEKLELMFNDTNEVLEKYKSKTKKILENDPRILKRIAAHNPILLDEFRDIVDHDKLVTLVRYGLTDEIVNDSISPGSRLPKLERIWKKNASPEIMDMALLEIESHSNRSNNFLERMFINEVGNDKRFEENTSSAFQKLLTHLKLNILKKPEILAPLTSGKIVEYIETIDPMFSQDLMDNILKKLDSKILEPELESLLKMATWLFDHYHKNNAEIKSKLAKIIHSQLGHNLLISNTNKILALNILRLVEPEKHFTDTETKALLRQTIVHHDKNIRELSLRLIEQNIQEEVKYLNGENVFKLLHERGFMNMAKIIGDKEVNSNSYRLDSEIDLLNFADIREPMYYHQLDLTLKKSSDNIHVLSKLAGSANSEFMVQQYLDIAEKNDKTGVKQYLLACSSDFYSRNNNHAPDQVLERMQKLAEVIKNRPMKEIDMILANKINSYLKNQQNKNKRIDISSDSKQCALKFSHISD